MVISKIVSASVAVGMMLITCWTHRCSAEIALEIRDDVAGAFIDISGTGNTAFFGDDQSRTTTSTVLGSSVRIGNNGGVSIGATGGLSWANVGLPSNRAFGGAEAFLPFWDDLDSESGAIYWQDVGDRFIVQWDDRNHYSGAGIFEGITFQAQILKRGADAAPGDIVAQFVYLDTQFAPSQSGFNNGSSATVGYQNGMGGAVGWSFNSAVITNGTVLTLQAVIPEPNSWTMCSVLSLFFLVQRRRKLHCK